MQNLKRIWKNLSQNRSFPLQYTPQERIEMQQQIFTSHAIASHQILQHCKMDELYNGEDASKLINLNDLQNEVTESICYHRQKPARNHGTQS